MVVFGQSHQGSLYPCDGIQLTNVQNVEVTGPPASGRNYAWPANTINMQRWGQEILVGFKDYQYVWQGYWQHTRYSYSLDSNDQTPRLVRSTNNGLTWTIESPTGYSDVNKTNPAIQDCSTIPGNGIPWTHPDLVFDNYWMEHSSDESRHYFHWSTDRGKTWSARYKLPLLIGYGHLEPRADYLPVNSSNAIVIVSGDNTYYSGGAWHNTWEGAWIGAYRTSDGGKTWAASQIGEKDSRVWKGMTTSIRIDANQILTAVRNHRIVNSPHPGLIQSVADVYASMDNGVTWQFRSSPWILEKDVFGNPCTLLKLNSGKIVALMSNRRSSSQSHGPYIVSKIQCRVSADNGQTWGPIYTIRDNGGTWDIGYQRAIVRDDGKVLTAYYFADDLNTNSTAGNYNGEEANHAVARRMVASIFDAESVDTTPMPINPYRQLEATACDFGNATFHTNFYITDFNNGKFFLFQSLSFNQGLSKIRLGLAAATGGGNIEVRDGGTNGTLLGTFTVLPTGGATTFSTQEIAVPSISGPHNLYFISRNNNVANIDYVQFDPGAFPIISQNPTNATLPCGANASFSVTVTGSQPLSFQWYFNSNSIAWGTNASLTLSNASVANNGFYQVILTNIYGSATSTVVTLTVTNAPPMITRNPQSAAVSCGGSASFTVAASSCGPITGYQWFLGANPVTGGNAATLTASGVDNSKLGPYYAVVANATGSSTSAVANLTTGFTENFNNAPTVIADGWQGFNTSVNGNNFGFRNSNLSGGSSGAGEAGGTFARRNAFVYYGDTTLGGTFTLNHALHADGELGTANFAGFNGDLLIGFFNTNSADQSVIVNFLGFKFVDPGNGTVGHRMAALLYPASGVNSYSAPLDSGTTAAAAYKFRLDYDPAGGGFGQGRLTVELFNSSGTAIGVTNCDLTAMQRTVGATFNAFGFLNGQNNDDATKTFDVYMDAVSYTVAVTCPVVVSAPISCTVSNGQPILTFTGLVNYAYTLQRSATLSPPTWTNIATVMPDGQGRIQFVDAGAPSTNAFYRTLYP